MGTQEVRTCLTMTFRPHRAAIRIYEDFAFKRKQQVVFLSDKNYFVRQNRLPTLTVGFFSSKSQNNQSVIFQIKSSE